MSQDQTVCKEQVGKMEIISNKLDKQSSWNVSEVKIKEQRTKISIIERYCEVSKKGPLEQSIAK